MKKIKKNNNIYISLRSFMSLQSPNIVRIFSNQSKLRFSTISSKNLITDEKLNPQFVTGFCDGESSFFVSIFRNKDYKLGWQNQPAFSISLHNKDSALLHKIQSFFGVGKIRVNTNKKMLVYSVLSIADLKNVIIPFFNKYPLLTQKRADFELFKLAVEINDRKEHLTIPGLYKLLSIRASMNKGLSKVLEEAFYKSPMAEGMEIIPVDSPVFKLERIPDPNWISGFSSGESCFEIRIIKNKHGSQVQLRFRISQHARDKDLLKLIIEYFKCGVLETSRNTEVFTVVKYADILNIIIPFFDKNPILGVKQLDYADFKSAAFLLKKEGCITSEDLEKIYKIKAGMNTARVLS
jgi:hypothetical protein